jgi:lon-related putative ATP-dependent protease
LDTRLQQPIGESKALGRTLVPVEQLYRPADLSALDFSTTADLKPLEGFLGQPRALDAIRLSAGVESPGFNLFAIGPLEARMREAVQGVLAEAAAKRPAPSDWTYVNNFADSRRPIAIALPAGRAPAFRSAMDELIDDLKAAVPAVFESEDYQAQRGAIEETYQKQQAEAFAALEQEAADKNIALLRTPVGFTLAPTRDGHLVPPDDFNKWPEQKRRHTQADLEALEKEVEHILHQIPQRQKSAREAVRKLNRQMAERAVGPLIEETKVPFSDHEAILAYLDRVRADLVDNVAMFIAEGGSETDTTNTLPGGPFDRYRVNVVVSQPAAQKGAPVIEESHPTLANLIGSIEHLSVQGALVTNFRLIRAGSIHRANGGYLLLDARQLLSEAFAWPALKRTLRRRDIVIEDVGRLLGLTSTVSLEPDPIPLDIKVVLFGDRLLYFLLAALDPELGEHFKVLADFDDDMNRSPESEALLARLIASLVSEGGLRPLERDAVAAMVEIAARLANDSGKLMVLVDDIRDLVTEADFWAAAANRKTCQRADVERAFAERIRRAARVRDRMQESMLKKVALVDTSGARIGQINGLSVVEMGGVPFGWPTRISAQVRPGAGRVIDIEREVELGGPIHSKGVLILSGFLAGRYALDTPMSLQASLVFEQSYSGVEGDSASLAELCALLSSLSGLPLRQDLAVTGSVNQHGDTQAIGAVNEKIEGFFDLCAARGLTGAQGVVVPRSNLRHLMLRKDVVQACADGRFAIHAAGSVDECLALMIGREAGERGADGHYPEASVNRLVEDRLRSFAQIRRRFAEEGAGPEGEKR